MNADKKQAKLERAVADYVDQGGRDAYAFSVIHEREFGDVPGKEIQRIIDEELSLSDLERDVRTFVERGGKTAHGFFIEHSGYYNDVPTVRVERLIMEERLFDE